MYVCMYVCMSACAHKVQVRDALLLWLSTSGSVAGEFGTWEFSHSGFQPSDSGSDACGLAVTPLPGADISS